MVQILRRVLVQILRRVLVQILRRALVQILDLKPFSLSVESTAADGA